VAAVVAYHMAPGRLRGGFFGVDVFFVISGYLITSLLTREWTRRGGIDLISFWGRRVRRLYPALLTLIVIVVVIGTIVAPATVARSRTTIPAALLYMTNWWFVLRPVPYFQRAGPPLLFIHFWSLAIEEQYYLTWPPILLLLLSRWRRPARIALMALAGAAAASILMAVLFGSGGEIDRIYYGSDTHSQGLLLGSALGLLVPPERLSRRVTEAARWCLDGIGGAALAGIVVMMVLVGQRSAFTWRGGLLLVVVLAGIVTVVAAHPASRLSGLLAVPPLRWLGTRSYSVYLWHWPILDLTRAHVDVPLHGAPLTVVQLALIGGAAELSFRFVEQPWRTGRAQAQVRLFLRRHRRHRRYAWAGATAALVAWTVVLASVTAPQTPPELRITATAAARAEITPLDPTATTAAPTITAPTNPAAATGATTSAATTGPAANGPATTGPATTGPATTGPATTGPATTGPKTAPVTTAPAGTGPPVGSGGTGGTGGSVLLRAPAAGPVLAIGDSVMLAASGDLETAFGQTITVDAAVGRQVDAGLDRLQSYRRAGRLDGLRALVIGLGSNGAFSPAQMHQLLALARGVPLLVLINVRVPDPWEAESNATIDGLRPRPGIRVVDWLAASARPGLLYPDAVHPDPAGQLVYANLVTRAVTGSSAAR
jgi:peptidoglycan/LPS O-acetylase OafA/YrhL